MLAFLEEQAKYIASPRVEVKARITSDLHRRLLEEQAVCGCSVSALIAIGLARELGIRKQRRNLELAGQMEIEEGQNA
jgi:hypothetical protein